VADKSFCCLTTHLPTLTVVRIFFDEIRFLAGWWLNLHDMEEHCIAVIERNAYIEARDGSLAANPALGGFGNFTTTYLFIDIDFQPPFLCVSAF
jgi:hypothetical protein